MYICNLGSNNNIETGKVKINLADVTEEGFLTFEEGKVINTNDMSKENIFLHSLVSEDGKEVYRKGKISPQRTVGITYNMIKETAENPLIITICDSVSFFSGIQCDIRFFIDEGKIYLMLISGIISVGGIELARCTTADITGREVIQYDADELAAKASQVFRDRDSNYDYSGDIVCPLVIEHENKENFRMGRVGGMDSIYFFNKDKLIKSQEKYAKERAEKEAEMASIRERQRLATERLRKQAEEARAEENKRREVKRKETHEEVNIGARDFLKIISELGQK